MNPTQYLIKNLGDEDLNGTFTLYYDDVNDERHPVPSEQWPGVLAAGGAMSVPAFTPPTDPMPKTFGEYFLVFTGTMGEEEPTNGSVGGVVAKEVTLASPFLHVRPASTYKSQHLDKGWEKIGDGNLLYGSGHYIKKDLIFVGTFGVYQSIDGGKTFFYTGFGSNLTYLGGTELLAVKSSSATYSPDLGVTWEVCPFSRGLDLLCYVGNGTVLANSDVIPPKLLREGLSKSTDKGITWTDVNPIVDGYVVWNPADDNPPDWFIDALVWNQVEGAGRVILASGILNVHDEAFSQICGLWKSVDGGTAWAHLSTGTTADSCDSYDSIYSVAIDPQGNALMAFYTGGTPLLYKSTDDAETWQLAEDPEPGGSRLGLIYLRNHLGVE